MKYFITMAGLGATCDELERLYPVKFIRLPHSINWIYGIQFGTAYSPVSPTLVHNELGVTIFSFSRIYEFPFSKEHWVKTGEFRFSTSMNRWLALSNDPDDISVRIFQDNDFHSVIRSCLLINNFRSMWREYWDSVHSRHEVWWFWACPNLKYPFEFNIEGIFFVWNFRIIFFKTNIDILQFS